MNKLICLVIFSFFSTGIYAQMKNLVQYVNTLQGTDSHFGLSYGNTYPTTGMPYAMHTWSAQTGKNGEGWKYQYAVDNIRGFCQSHQCSPWMSDYAVYSFMPMVGKLVVNQEMRATKFSDDNEIAKPHYYKVMLDNGITTEMAPTTRGVHLRFSYPSTEDAYLVIDGYTDMSEIKIDPAKRQISGWVNNQRFVNNSKTFRSYFVVQFDKVFEDYGMWENQKDEIFPKKLEGEGKGYGAYIKFKKGSKVQAKAASSYISAEQAVITLNDELGKDKNLETTKIRGHKTWNELLNRIQVEGGTDEQMKTFYSCLFRANLFSRKFYERKANGEPYYYSPYDGKVYDGYMYTDNGFWDTFRSQFPLTNILHPTMQGRYMNALLAAQEQCGWLPSWSAPGETGGMLGNHSISLLADAWAKGIRTFDPEKALKAYAHEAMNKGPWGGANGRGFWKEYFELGYVPYPESMGSSAQTMEYAYDDFCGYQLAKMTGNKHYQEVFARQIELAVKYGRPLIVHAVRADAWLEGFWAKLPPKFVFHSFSGSREQLNKIMIHGGYAGFGYSVLRSRHRENVLKSVPAERMLLETDGPYQSPVPHTETLPEQLPELALILAGLREESECRFAEQTYRNSERLINGRDR